MNRAWRLAVIAAMVIGTWGCASSYGGGGMIATTSQTIDVVDNSSASTGFSFQGPLLVNPGVSVTWLDQTSGAHGITWDAQTPSSQPGPGANIPVFQAGATSAAWTVPSVTVITTYNYHDTEQGTNMAGQIIVYP